MGANLYNSTSRSVRAVTSGFATKSVDQIFEQNRVRKIHESMSPVGLKFRECRDSEVHPETLPIIIGLDVTGSMGVIPHELIKQGLPTLMSKLIEKGVPHAAVCFVAIGDHKSDEAPLQVGQFESGDAELDMFLTRTWLEGNGGGNGGESYSVAYYFAAKHVVSDAWEKRKQKGFLFTVGDEPIHAEIPATAIKEIFGKDEPIEGTVDTSVICKEAQEKFNCFHVALSDRGDKYWKELLKEGYLLLDDYTKVADFIADKIIECVGKRYDQVKPTVKVDEPATKEEQEIL